MAPALTPPAIPTASGCSGCTSVSICSRERSRSTRHPGGAPLSRRASRFSACPPTPTPAPTMKVKRQSPRGRPSRPRPALRVALAYREAERASASAEEHLGAFEQARVEQLRLGQSPSKVHLDDVRATQRDHPPEMPSHGGVHRGDAEACGEHTVIGCGRAPALHMAKDRRASLIAGPRLDLARQLDADAAEAGVSELVRRML